MVLSSARKANSDCPRAGYTLTEMLVVVAIIGLISAVVIPQTIGQLGKAQSRSAKLQAQTVAAAVELFSGDNGRFPTEEEGLIALVRRPAGLDSWTGPYLRTEDQLKDPWGRPFIYTEEEGTFSITTLGANNKVGGEGPDRDITLRQ
ncbi:MAG TPA: type II secretion system major pseudopilin GspG [Caulobacter sp.]|nr:type II secretion system major pseudopilin GspG [Caulobacter sp.]